jgi:hypothetical protein
MKKSSALAIAAALLVAFVWFLWPRNDTEGGPAVPGRPELPASSAPAAPQPAATAPASAIAPLEISHLADQLNSPATDIRADLRILTEVLTNFRSNFPHDGNPVGNNAEITTTLTGSNKLRYAVIPPNHPAINRAGELCDRWGTPFFFHAESANKMGIRSAGPDKKMWTDDDVVVAP